MVESIPSAFPEKTGRTLREKHRPVKGLNVLIVFFRKKGFNEMAILNSVLVQLHVVLVPVQRGNEDAFLVGTPGDVGQILGSERRVSTCR